MNDINWVFKCFENLSVFELYAILQLRNDVFIVEQNSIYRDLDNKDLKSHHMMGWCQKELVAYARIIPPGISYEEASIGRVVSNKSFRKFGIGKELMKRSIDKTIDHFNCRHIKISAQLYLKKFYESFGFVALSNVYMEDGIPHIKMLLNKDEKTT